MNHEEIKTLREAEDFISGIHHEQAKGMAHIAVMLAVIRRNRMFLEVATSWKAYIKQDRQGIGYSQSRRLANIGEKYLTFRDQLEKNGILLSENMSKMELFDSEIASRDPVFFDKFKSLSYRELRSYIRRYKMEMQTSAFNSAGGNYLTVNGASLYAGDRKVRGINLNECRREAEAGKVAVLVWASDSAEARRIKRRLGK